jgi:hypothetical protein
VVAASKNPKLVHKSARGLNLSFPHMDDAYRNFATMFPNLESNNVDDSTMIGNGNRGDDSGSLVHTLSDMRQSRVVWS